MRELALLIAAGFAFCLSACASGTVPPTPLPTAAQVSPPTPFLTVTPAPTASATPLPTATGTPTAAPSPTPAPSPLLTRTPLPTATPTATVAPSLCPQGCREPPPECAIKGNISVSGEKIYHMPGQRFYVETVINAERGERWFCTEAEARANGWRKSLQ